jgi:hypothetical protein
LTCGTTRVVGRQPCAPATSTREEIPGTHFQRLSRPQGTWFRRGVPRKKSPVTPPGIDSRTVRLVAQCLNHYDTPGPQFTSAVTIIRVFGWRYMSYCLREHCNKFKSNPAIAMTHNGLHLALCNATNTIHHLAQRSDVTAVFYKHLVCNNSNIHATVYSATINRV